MKAEQILAKLQSPLRQLESFGAAGSRLPLADGSYLLNFCSNDYLNLGTDARLKQAAIEATQHYGTGAGSSRLLSGHLDIHQQLEEELAAWSGYEAALSFGSGYLANVGVLVGLLEPGAYVLADRLNHASLVDGLRLAEQSQHCHWQRYKHLDMEDLEQKLQVIRQQKPKVDVWILSDSVFSMDGDCAKLQQLGQLAEHYGAHWVADEAHAIGIFGPAGTGLSSQLGLRPDVLTANFSKALGSYGGFCLCSEQLKQLLVNRARSLIYSTALAPSCIAAARAALHILQEDAAQDTAEDATKAEQDPSPKNAQSKQHGYSVKHEKAKIAESLGNLKTLENLENLGSLGARLRARAETFYLQLHRSLGGKLRTFETQIIPLVVGKQALSLADALRKRGILAKAIRPPTVAAGTERLRFSVTLGHSPEDLRYAAEQILAVYQHEEARL